MAKELRVDGKFGSLYEMNFYELFPKEAEEDERLKGGCYRKRYILIEEIPAEAIDMEALLDEAKELLCRSEEPAEEEYTGNTPWEDDFRPTAHDLLPFHVPVASMDAFRSLFPGKTRVKTTYHRGGKKIIPKKEVFF